MNVITHPITNEPIGVYPTNIKEILELEFKRNSLMNEKCEVSKIDKINFIDQATQEIKDLITKANQEQLERIYQKLVDFPKAKKQDNPDLIKRSEFAYYLSTLNKGEEIK